MNRFGFVRITCVSLRVRVANPAANAEEVARMLGELESSDIVLFPELCLTGYTSGDLFGQSALLNAAEAGLRRVVEATVGKSQLLVVGMPLRLGAGLYNTAVAVGGGRVLGAVPKQHLPNYGEFYEDRWFQPARGGEPPVVSIGRFDAVPFGADLLFEVGPEAVVGVEVCEDLWVPIAPSARLAMGGATILLNPSASNQTIGKSAYRRDLVVGQSGRCLAAYAYAGAGPSESTTDLVFAGHCLIAENGRLLNESSRVGDGQAPNRGSYTITSDVDVARLAHDRRYTTSFAGGMRPWEDDAWRRVAFPLAISNREDLKRYVPGTPFVPAEDEELHRRCAEIFGIQCAGLAKRLEQLPADMPLNIGVSGGLDSTLALLVAVKTCDLLGRPRGVIHGLTMPGFGTTKRTLTNARELMDHLKIRADSIDIRPLAMRTFRELGHKPFGLEVGEGDPAVFQEALSQLPSARREDLVFENVQARLRTFLLMSRGFVVGTGDLSELALGWATYNGDHMSMYNVNCSIPKTLVRFLVRYVARHEFEPGAVRETLLSIAETMISPELLPTTADGQIEQSTEATLGPYELHDFFLYHMIRCGYGPAKIREISRFATFSKPYPPEMVERTLRTFLRRFFAQQYKRSCVPDGPKVGTVSLSPRGDWRMPSDAEATAWLEELER